MRPARRRAQTAVSPTVQEPNIDAVASGLSSDAKSLLLWLLRRPAGDQGLEGSGLEEREVRAAFVELEDAGLVRQIPLAAASVDIPREVRLALEPPLHLRTMLGPLPEDPQAAAAWKSAARAIEDYRERWGIKERHAMGINHNFSGGKAQRDEAVATWAVIHEYRRVRAAHAAPDLSR